MASGQLFNPFLITMLSVCGAATLVFYVRKLRALKRSADDRETEAAGERSFRLTGAGEPLAFSLVFDDDNHAAFKDSWQNGTWQGRDRQPTFTDRAFS